MLSNDFFKQWHSESTIFSLEQKRKKRSLNSLYNMQHWMSWLMKPQGIWNRAHITGAILRPRSLLFCKNYYGNASIHCSLFIRSISILSLLEYSNICQWAQECEFAAGSKLFLKDGGCSFICLRSQSEHIRIILLCRKEGAWSSRKKGECQVQVCQNSPVKLCISSFLNREKPWVCQLPSVHQ